MAHSVCSSSLCCCCILLCAAAAEVEHCVSHTRVTEPGTRGHFLPLPEWHGEERVVVWGYSLIWREAWTVYAADSSMSPPTVCLWIIPTFYNVHWMIVHSCIFASVICGQDRIDCMCLFMQIKLRRLLNVLKVKEVSSSALQSSDNISEDVSGVRCAMSMLHVSWVYDFLLIVDTLIEEHHFTVHRDVNKNHILPGPSQRCPEYDVHCISAVCH